MINLSKVETENLLKLGFGTDSQFCLKILKSMD